MSAFETNRSQAQSLLEQSKAAQALPILQRLIRSHPDDVQANNLIAIAHNQLGKPQTALHYVQRALSLAPKDPGLAMTHARTLGLLTRTEEAVAVLRSAVRQSPDHAGVVCDLALLLVGLGRARQAVDVLRDSPIASHADVQASLATALKRLGRTDEALSAWTTAHGDAPADVRAASGLCTLLNYASTVSPERAAAAHRHFGLRLAEVSSLPRRPFDTTPLTGRPLRIGMVSPDFREHSVAYFVEPILRHAHKSLARFILYYTDPVADAVTERLGALAGTLRRVHDLPSDALAEAIRRDNIDVLIDLTGLTDGHRMQTFHLKPAPLAVTAIGYPNTTGVRAIDWRLVDSLTDPPGAERFTVEALWRLDPCFLCYQPPGDALVPSPPRPREGGRPFTFCSFNSLKKINDGVLRAWAQIVRLVPGSRLLLKNSDLADAETRADLSARFAAAGTDPSCLSLIAWTATTHDHLALYHGADLALDTFPYNGTTTTCEALFMGVPVVAVAGDRHAARVGLSLLSAAGLPELVAPDLPAYTRLAAALAGDTPRLEALRTGLRERLLRSPLCDGRAYASRFIGDLRRMFARAVDLQGSPAT